MKRSLNLSLKRPRVETSGDLGEKRMKPQENNPIIEDGEVRNAKEMGMGIVKHMKKGHVPEEKEEKREEEEEKEEKEKEEKEEKEELRNKGSEVKDNIIEPELIRDHDQLNHDHNHDHNHNHNGQDLVNDNLHPHDNIENDDVAEKKPEPAEGMIAPLERISRIIQNLVRNHGIKDNNDDHNHNHSNDNDNDNDNDDVRIREGEEDQQISHLSQTIHRNLAILLLHSSSSSSSSSSFTSSFSSSFSTPSSSSSSSYSGGSTAILSAAMIPLMDDQVSLHLLLTFLSPPLLLDFLATSKDANLRKKVLKFICHQLCASSIELSPTEILSLCGIHHHPHEFPETLSFLLARLPADPPDVLMNLYLNLAKPELGSTLLSFFCMVAIGTNPPGGVVQQRAQHLLSSVFAAVTSSPSAQFYKILATDATALLSPKQVWLLYDQWLAGDPSSLKETSVVNHLAAKQVFEIFWGVCPSLLCPREISTAKSPCPPDHPLVSSLLANFWELCEKHETFFSAELLITKPHPDALILEAGATHPVLRLFRSCDDSLLFFSHWCLALSRQDRIGCHMESLLRVLILGADPVVAGKLAGMVATIDSRLSSDPSSLGRSVSKCLTEVLGVHSSLSSLIATWKSESNQVGDFLHVLQTLKPHVVLPRGLSHNLTALLSQIDPCLLDPVLNDQPLPAQVIHSLEISCASGSTGLAQVRALLQSSPFLYVRIMRFAEAQIRTTAASGCGGDLPCHFPFSLLRSLVPSIGLGGLVNVDPLGDCPFWPLSVSPLPLWAFLCVYFPADGPSYLEDLAVCLQEGFQRGSNTPKTLFSTQWLLEQNLRLLEDSEKNTLLRKILRELFALSAADGDPLILVFDTSMAILYRAGLLDKDEKKTAKNFSDIAAWKGVQKTLGLFSEAGWSGLFTLKAPHYRYSPTNRYHSAILFLNKWVNHLEKDEALPPEDLQSWFLFEFSETLRAKIGEVATDQSPQETHGEIPFFDFACSLVSKYQGGTKPPSKPGSSFSKGLSNLLRFFFGLPDAPILSPFLIETAKLIENESRGLMVQELKTVFTEGIVDLSSNLTQLLREAQSREKNLNALLRLMGALAYWTIPLQYIILSNPLPVLCDLLAHPVLKVQVNSSLALQVVFDIAGKDGSLKEVLRAAMPKNFMSKLLGNGLSLPDDPTPDRDIITRRLCGVLEIVTSCFKLDGEIIGAAIQNASFVSVFCQFLTHEFVQANVTSELVSELVLLFKTSLSSRSFSKNADRTLELLFNLITQLGKIQRNLAQKDPKADEVLLTSVMDLLELVQGHSNLLKVAQLASPKLKTTTELTESSSDLKLKIKNQLMKLMVPTKSK